VKGYGPPNWTQLPVFIKTDSLGNTVFTAVFNPEHNMQPVLFYPNPASTKLYLNPGSMENEKKILFTLYDLQGRAVLQKEVCDAAKPIDLSVVPEGLYVAVLKGKEKEVRGKVVIQR
ncbi:MAG: T9SS type A sorting domain-containing protein, partial [Bacteroidia bacterium]